MKTYIGAKIILAEPMTRREFYETVKPKEPYPEMMEDEGQDKGKGDTQ